jgi:hypothetical protein
MSDNSHEVTGRAKGGKAKNAKMTPEQRKEQGRKMAEAKKEKARLIKATHEGVLRIGAVELPCSVLENGMRVLSMSRINEAFTGTRGGGAPDKDGAQNLPRFLNNSSVKPFINNDLMARIILPAEYAPLHGGRSAFGYEATLLPEICEVILDANHAGKLKNQGQAKVAETLLRGFARVGIIALIDEATGYQRDRARDALAKILEAYVAKELQPYVRTFEPVFYENMFRLRGLPYPPEKVSYRPSYFGHLTNDIVYSRLAPGVLRALKDEAKKEDKNMHLHRFLTPGYGKLELIKHLAMVVAYMRESKSWKDFVAKMNKYAPRFNETIPLNLDEDDR